MRDRNEDTFSAVILVVDTVDGSRDPAAHLYTNFGGSLAGTSKAPAGRTAHARCGPQSLALLAPCGPFFACAVLPAAPLSPAPHNNRSLIPPQPRRTGAAAPVRLPRTGSSRPLISGRSEACATARAVLFRLCCSLSIVLFSFDCAVLFRFISRSPPQSSSRASSTTCTNSRAVSVISSKSPRAAAS